MHSMRTSCINHPTQEPLIIQHKWQMEACEDDGCAARLLSHFEYWHNIKLRTKSQSIQLNKVAECHGEESIQDASLLQWHTIDELKTALFEYGAKRIRDAIKFLVQKGFISLHRNPNPKYSFDNTRHFLFHPEKVNYWLETARNRRKAPAHVTRSNCSVPPCPNDMTVLPNEHDGPAERAPRSCPTGMVVLPNLPEQYTKTTSKITSEITTKITPENKSLVTQARPSGEQAQRIEQIFIHWKQAMNHPNAKLDIKRKALITKSLVAGYSEQALCEAISGCAKTPHNMGDNDRGQRYDGLHIILRDADQIDRFISNCHSPPRRITKADRLTQDNFNAVQSWLTEDDEFGAIYESK